MKRLSVIGGDIITIEVIKELANEGYEILIYGEEDTYELNENKSIKYSSDLKEVISYSDYLLGGIPLLDNTNNIFSTFNPRKTSFEELFETMKKSKEQKTLISYDLDNAFKERLIRINHKVLELDQNDKMKVLRAVCISEGAVKIAIEETPYCINQSKVLILGYGKVGKYLCKLFHSLGAKVYCEARKDKDLLWIKANGYTPINLKQLADNLEDKDIIVNTVPSLILDESNLKFVNKDTLLIDLSYNPQGIDKFECRRRNLKYKWPLSIPAKYAPLTYAKAIRIGLKEFGI